MTEAEDKETAVLNHLIDQKRAAEEAERQRQQQQEQEQERARQQQSP